MSRSRPLVFPQLDGLRGLAALDVLVHHFWPESTRWDLTGGRLGVDVFFVLSGFLITRTLLRARDRDDRSRVSSLGDFFRRRILRIVPVFYLTLMLSLLLPSEHTRAFFWHLAFLSNIYFIRLGHFAGAGAHLWALAVEQHFYLFWPFVMLWVPRRHLGAAAWAMIAIGIAFRATAGIMGWSNLTIDVMTPGVFEALGCGALLTFLLEARETTPERRGWRISWLAIVGTSLIILRALTKGGSSETWFSLTTTEWSRSLLIAWLIGQCVWGLPGVIGRLLESNAARALGLWSYAIYVSHNFMYGLFKVWGGSWRGLGPHNTQAILALVATLAYSKCCYAWIEEPLIGRARPREKKIAI